jgi:short-subunit dehydrogenase
VHTTLSLSLSLSHTLSLSLTVKICCLFVCTGRVINVSSAKGRAPVPSCSVYGLTKYAVENFSDILRLEMLKFGVKVVIIEPGNFGGVTGMLSKKSVSFYM